MCVGIRSSRHVQVDPCVPGMTSISLLTGPGSSDRDGRMQEIICPNCGKAFRIDEAGYADILK